MDDKRSPSTPPDPPNLFWGRRPTNESPAIRRAAAIASAVLADVGPRAADRSWILIVEADSTGPTELDETWTIEESDDRTVRAHGEGFGLEIVERDACLRRLAAERPRWAAAIEKLAKPFIAVLIERDGTAISICEGRMHWISGRHGRA